MRGDIIEKKKGAIIEGMIKGMKITEGNQNIATRIITERILTIKMNIIAKNIRNHKDVENVNIIISISIECLITTTIHTGIWFTTA